LKSPMASREVDIDRVVQGTLFGEAALTAEIAALLADEDGQYIAVNDEALRLTGCTRSELTGYRMGSLGADEQSKAIYQQINRRNFRAGSSSDVATATSCSAATGQYWHTSLRFPTSCFFLWPTTQQ
jgi:PAS domain S-box-containing protein